MSKSPREPEGVETGEAGQEDEINLYAVLAALLVLVGVVAVLFYVLPGWLGTSSVSVIVRPP